MKIVVVGTRGIPGIQGGVETHCEQLYPRLVELGHDVTVIRRSCYVDPDDDRREYRGVKLVDVYAPRRKSLEATLHTALAVIRARSLNPDIVHLHAVGPALMVPLARLLGMKVVMTNHGPDYNRQKWGRLAKTLIRTGERWGTRWSNGIIVISQVISDILRTNYGRTDTCLIYNGVERPQKAVSSEWIESLGVKPGGYILALGRLVKEKGFHDLLAAWQLMGPDRPQLVIAGDADHDDEYSRKLKADAASAGAVMTGFIKGDRLREVMSHAALFCLPSYHEGLPIALLEAMSYDLDVVVSDIPANRLAELDADRDFFPVGNVEALAEALSRKSAAPATPRTYDLSSYSWDNIARQTSDFYRKITK